MDKIVNKNQGMLLIAIMFYESNASLTKQRYTVVRNLYILMFSYFMGIRSLDSRRFFLFYTNNFMRKNDAKMRN